MADFDKSIQILHDSLEDIHEALEVKLKTPVSDPLKVIDVAGYIEQIESGKAIRIIVTAPDYEEQTLTATLGSKKYTGVVEDGTAIITVEDGGVYTISAEDGNETEIEITVQYDWETELSSIIGHHFGIRITKSESDPQKRVEPLEDLVGLTPITVDKSTGEVNYGDMDKTFLFQAMNHIVALSIDGTDEIELDPNDYTKKLNGETFTDLSSLTSNYNIFARCDKLYTYQYSDSTHEYFYIADHQVNGNYVPNGFYNAESENNYCYVGAFAGSYDSSSKLRSISGQSPRMNTNYSDFSSAAKKNGEDYYMDTYSVGNLYEIAYLCMFQNERAQVALGTGRDYGIKDTGNIMTITTGVTNNKGAITYDPSSKAVKFMHIEDFWGNNLSFWEEGRIGYKYEIYAKMKPPYPTSSKTDYKQVPGATFTSGSNSGYISSSVAGNEYGRVPIAFKGTQTTYQCNFGLVGSGTIVSVSCRGKEGLSYAKLNHTTTNYAQPEMGARLTYIPPAD